MNAITDFFDGHIAYAFAWTMIHSLWQCAIVAAVLAVSLRITGNHSAALRYLQGILAMGVCVLVSAITFGRYYSDISGTENAIQAFGSALEIAYSGGLWEQVYVTVNDNLNFIILFWTLGFLVQFSRYSYDFAQALTLKNKDCESINGEWERRFRYLAAQLDIHKTISVKYSRQISSTCIIGHFKPVILLPIGLLTFLPADQVEALVLHELAHIKRNDYLVNAVQCFVRLLYFFNPAVLWISSKVDIERENACDDIAVEYCGNPKLYARSLANISELELKLATVLAANKHGYQILPRVKRLFGRAHGLSKSMEKLVSAVCVLFVMLTMNVSAKEFDFIKSESLKAGGTAVLNQEPTPAAAAQPASEPLEPVETVEAVPSPASSSPAVKPARLPAAPENVMPATELKATPEIDYATKLVAMQQTDISLERTASVPLMQLADAGDRAAQRATKAEAGLEPMQTPEFQDFLIASDFKLPLTRKIHITRPQVEFAQVWLDRYQSETSSSYRDYVTRTYGEALVDTLKEALTESGWEISDEPAADAIQLTPRLFDLYIYAPESVGLKQTIVRFAGQAAIELVFKTDNSQPFIKIVDYRKTRDSIGSPFVANRATNYFYFKLMMSNWADSAIMYLNNVMSIAEKQNG
ncbi:MAG TPA: M56 family metallopeptidase [Gammaproteobacteria bacterium]